ncbi:MAG: hypothetical protein HC869_19690, partial [Rhodospirillales bacterium]|nr:hypothetical protein [Rhodospirillales bacterium]
RRVAVRRLPDPAYAVFGARSYVDASPAALTDGRYAQCTWIGFDDSYQTSASLVWLRDKLGRWPHVRCNHSTTIYDALVGAPGSRSSRALPARRIQASCA